jgi:murein DD-endopeptidase MepM/ murein hydrolase activator NlpD
VISDGFGSPRPGQRHAGVDLMFARISTDAIGTNDPHGSKGFVMPGGWPAVAASDGVLWSAGWSARGFEVVIHHGTVATYYQHLSALFVPQTQAPRPNTAPSTLRRIQVGEPLGIIGGDPTNPPHLMHLHFELWPAGPTSAIDPALLMKTWQVLTPADVAPFFATAMRNARAKQTERPDLVKVRGYERRWPGTALDWRP